jgi:hypothetical protein
LAQVTEPGDRANVPAESRRRERQAENQAENEEHRREPIGHGGQRAAEAVALKLPAGQGRQSAKPDAEKKPAPREWS